MSRDQTAVPSTSTLTVAVTDKGNPGTQTDHQRTNSSATMSGMGTEDAKRRNQMSLNYAMDESGHPTGLPLDLFLFSDVIQPKGAEAQEEVIRGARKYRLPDTKVGPTYELSQLPGQAPLSDDFHLISNRERRGPDDDGLEDDDLTHADGRVRKKTQLVRRRSIIYDNIWTYKGEFLFPYRTYRPKVQVSYKGGAGQVPQAVVCERLHRLYKRTDINVVLQLLGVESSDLVPPPNYAESNERFYQEMTFRNRVRVNGIFKRDFILQGRKKLESFQEEHLIHAHLHAPKDGGSSVSYPSSEDSNPSTSNSETEIRQNTVPTQEKRPRATKQGNIQDHIEDHHLDDIHPFIRSKPPFGHMFPVNCFDDWEFDIRPALEWMSLGMDLKDRKFYCLPGKAFMPLPGSSKKKKSAAMSETVTDNLLQDTPRMNKMYHWLLKERYDRTVRMLGLDPDQVKNHPTDVDMGLLARVATAVPALFKASDTRLVERITQQLKAARTDTENKNSEAGSLRNSVLDGDEFNILGDISSDSRNTSSRQPNMMEYIDANGNIIRVKNVIYKKRKDKRRGSQWEEDDDEEEDGTMENETGDDTEDLESMSDFEDDEEEGDEDMEAEEDDDSPFEEDESKSNTWSGLPSQAIINGDYGSVRPTSPNVDPFVDGHDKYVMEFDKMKKVHVYDWKWVDVAVFDYNEKTERFYVRTIYAPIVHAWVHKIYLCFDGEDPHQHGKRIREAVVRRIESENIMRFNLYIDCLPVDGLPSITEETMEVVLAKTLSTPRLQYTEQSLEKVKLELDLEHKRTFAKAKFIQIMEKHHHLYKPWVLVPEQDRNFCYLIPEDATAKWKKLVEISEEIPKQVFSYKKLRVMKLSVRFGEKEPRDTLNKIQEICIEARKKHLILTDLETMTIDEWEQRQKENIAEVRKFLTEEWCQLVVDALLERLSKIPHSWYNLKETNFDVFIMSKLNNYLTLVKLMMEDTIRSMVVESLERLIDRLKEVTSEIDYKRKFAWDKKDLMKSLYPTPKGVTPLWAIDIVMEADSARYNHLLGDFVTVVKSLFIQVVESVKDLPTLLPRVMPQMQFATRPFLLCPEVGESEMLRLNSEMQKLLKRTLLPVDTYVLLYNRYLSIWNTEEFLKEWNVKRHSADEVSAEVELHRSEESTFEREIPKTINITGFTVNVESLREALLQKKKSMYTTILDAHAQKLRRIIQRVNEEYEEMERKLNVRSNIIEEVKDLKLYVSALPEQVEKLQEITMGVIKDYEVFDRFLYNVPDDDVSAKWMTALYSGTVMRLGKAAVNWLIDDYDNSLDQQQEKMTELSLEIEELANSVMDLSKFVELAQAGEACEQIEKLNEQERVLSEKCAMLNRRQKIFGADFLFEEELENILAGIDPYHDLWFTCVEWLKVIDSVHNGALEDVDIDALVSVINDGVDKISECAEHFEEAGLEKVEEIALKVKDKMNEFLPLAPLMRALRNDALRPRHWSAISKITGIPVVAKTENFKTLLDKGIATHAEKIVNMGELATKELEIEVALEKMQDRIAEFPVTFTLDPVSKQHLIAWSDEAKKMVQELVAETEELKHNQYNKPFEQDLAKWEKKITMAKNSMELWIKLQQDWVVEIEPWFRAADVKTRLPAEYKLFEKMQRIWKRLIRNIKSQPVLIELASDSTVAASLAQFDELATSMKSALEEHQRPKKGSDEDSD